MKILDTLRMYLFMRGERKGCVHNDCMHTALDEPVKHNIKSELTIWRKSKGEKAMCYNGCRFFQPHSERCTLPKGRDCPEDIDDERAAEREREEDDYAYEWAMEQRYASSDDWR